MTAMIGALGASVFLGFLVAVAWWDVRHFRIPNGLNAAFVALFALAAATGMFPKDGLWGHVGAGAVGLAAGMVIYARGWTGGGDAKLLGALVLWTGWTADALRLIAVMALMGGVISLVVWWAARRRAPAIDGRPPEQAKVPYGLALAVAGFDFWMRRLFPLILS